MNKIFSLVAFWLIVFSVIAACGGGGGGGGAPAVTPIAENEVGTYTLVKSIKEIGTTSMPLFSAITTTTYTPSAGEGGTLKLAENKSWSVVYPAFDNDYVSLFSSGLSGDAYYINPTDSNNGGFQFLMPPGPTSTFIIGDYHILDSYTVQMIHVPMYSDVDRFIKIIDTWKKVSDSY